MSTNPSDPAPAPPKWKPLEPRQRRVLGVMIEKAKTTPAAYPMTVNAIVTGSNQKNNRDPLTQLDDTDVENALAELGRMGAVSEMDWLGRVPKYKHHAYEWLGVSRVELAVMAELLLRGAQALGDLRGRAARMEPITDLAALKPIVDALVERGLMIELTPPGRGQVVGHNLYSAPELAELRAQWSGRSGATAAGFDDPERRVEQSRVPAVAQAGADVAGITALRAEVEELRERIAALEASLEPPVD